MRQVNNIDKHRTNNEHQYCKNRNQCSHNTKSFGQLTYNDTGRRTQHHVYGHQQNFDADANEYSRQPHTNESKSSRVDRRDQYVRRLNIDQASFGASGKESAVTILFKAHYSRIRAKKDSNRQNSSDWT